MDISRIFIAYAIAVGVVVGGLIIAYPQSRDFTIAPYFWVLIAFGVFELIAFARAKVSGPPITAQTRIIGFAVSIALMIAIPMGAGMPLKVF
jgi:hypothetical protein